MDTFHKHEPWLKGARQKQYLSYVMSLSLCYIKELWYICVTLFGTDLSFITDRQGVCLHDFIEVVHTKSKTSIISDFDSDRKKTTVAITDIVINMTDWWGGSAGG
jgi:hypothetical protein